VALRLYSTAPEHNLNLLVRYFLGTRGGRIIHRVKLPFDGLRDLAASVTGVDAPTRN